MVFWGWTPLLPAGPGGYLGPLPTPMLSPSPCNLYAPPRPNIKSCWQHGRSRVPLLLHAAAARVTSPHTAWDPRGDGAPGWGHLGGCGGGPHSHPLSSDTGGSLSCPLPDPPVTPGSPQTESGPGQEWRGGGAGSTGTASGTAMSLEAIRYRRGSLSILNQLLLPEQLRYEPVDSVERAWEAIRAMEVSWGGGSRDPQPPPPPIRGWPPS